MCDNIGTMHDAIGNYLSDEPRHKWRAPLKAKRGHARLVA